MKVFQVFESYPLFYQPYIPPTLELLSKQEGIDSKILAFKGVSHSNDATILPNYKKRSIQKKINKLFNSSTARYNYLENKAIRENVDIIHIQHSYLFNKIKGLLDHPFKDQPKTVITLRGGDTYVKPWVSQRWKDFYMNYGHKVDAFIVMSQDQKKYLSRWGVPLDNIHVIPISFGQAFKIEPKYPNKDKMRIVSIFRMCWEKNIADNLRLVKQIKEHGISVEYDVYGDGTDLGQVYYLLDRYGLNDCVSVKGKVDNQKIKDKLDKYDFILQLSHSESFGMSVVEAQTYGVPAIVSNSDGLPETINSTKSGFIVDRQLVFEKIAIEIIDFWRNNNKYIRMSKEAILYSQSNFSISQEVSRLSELYKNIIS